MLCCHLVDKIVLHCDIDTPRCARAYFLAFAIFSVGRVRHCTTKLFTIVATVAELDLFLLANHFSASVLALRILASRFPASCIALAISGISTHHIPATSGQYASVHAQLPVVLPHYLLRSDRFLARQMLQ